jgi:ABC-type transporter Mla subunit MlaD
MTESQSTILLIEIGVAIAIQAIVLLGILITVRKSSSKMESLAEELHKRTIPILEASNSMLQTARPQIETIVANLSETSTMLKEQVGRIDATVTEVLDRTRLQVIRADELVSRTMEKVETTTEFVQHTVISPVRQVAGVLQALTTGMNVLFGRRRQAGGNGHGVGVPGDEMFI